MILIKTKEQFENEVLQADKPVLTDFYAEWCGPCKALAPLLEEMDKTADTYRIAKVNIDEMPELAQSYRVSSVPTLLLFKDGENLMRSVGMKNRSEIEKMIEAEIG